MQAIFVCSTEGFGIHMWEGF